MDFYQIKERSIKKGVIEVYPDFKVVRSKDLMVRGKAFYAIWDEDKGLWSTDEYDVQRLVDRDLIRYKSGMITDEKVVVKSMSDFSSRSWVAYRSFISNISDNSHQLDEHLTFSNQDVKKRDYVSKKLPYPLEKGKHDAYDEIISTLYSEDERAKIEWAIGAIVAGDAKDIQKFIVFYGEAGAGKSTILNIIQKLFDGYYTTFEAKALTSTSNAFSTEVFKKNPLVAIQHDGDLSRIEDNTKLNSIISHEEMTMNEKYKASYTSRVNCFLFMATNRPVKITDAKSGIIRRLIDVRPSGNRIPNKRYQMLMNQIDFELSGIAQHCLEVYQKMGKNYYSSYKPVDMMLQTDVFYNYVESCYERFLESDGVSLKSAYEMYKQYCDDTLVDFKLPRYKFREELKNYFKEFRDFERINGKQIRSYYKGFIHEKFKREFDTFKVKEEAPYSLVFDSTESIFDKEYGDCLAQLATTNETPKEPWDKVKTTLKDINTKKIHYVRVPENHIVIDFDIKDKGGNKSFEKNLEAASKWPATYSELSKSGAGIHLHYIYDGDVSKLSRVYDDEIEVKVFSGKSSLRRKLTKCNTTQIATISSGLPLKKGGGNVVNFENLKNEKAIINRIKKCLNKEHHGATKPEVDFIFKTLEDAYNDGIDYDVSIMRPRIIAFANNSTNQSEYCLNLVDKMHFCSEERESKQTTKYKSNTLIFFDVEVFPNLFVVVWKARNKAPVKMINPTSEEIEELLRFKLVGFNCRRYDNHILYGRLLGYDNQELFKLSQKIVNGSKSAMFREAYNLSYTDVYDFCSKKQSLKKWEIELGIHHQELGLKWDEDAPEELWDKIADYCINDVVATEKVFFERKEDWLARQILSKLSGLSENDTTNNHTTKLIVGSEKNPQSSFIYTDLSEMFPGYIFDAGKSYYRDEEVGEGGYVYAEPGMYSDVALLDIASMHPSSAINLNIFGPYTSNFEELVKARLYIKHKEYDKASKLFGGKLEPYLKDEEEATSLAYALKIAINSVYGLTAAKFTNKLRDPRNVDNIVAKRGALFMINLKHEVQERGYTVAHIKTDSIKIPNADKKIIKFVQEYGKKYGYIFEHEATYEKMCLVNDAVYVAKYKDGDWTATGTQFIQPYVFKTLFSHETIKFEDMCETKSVSTALYLDLNEDLPEGEHNYHFVGKVGLFCPIKPGCGGGLLMREKDGKYNAATGSKGYRWLEAEMVKVLNKKKDIDKSYYTSLVDEAVKDISEYGDFEWFVS